MENAASVFEETIRQIVRDEFAKLAPQPKPLRALRKAANLTQTDLADASGVGAVTISHYENGKIDLIRKSTREKLARALGVTAKEIA